MSQSIPTGYIPPPGKFFWASESRPPGQFFCLIPCPGAKNDGRIPRDGAKFSQARRNCCLSLQKIHKKLRKLREVSFLSGGGSWKLGGDQVFFLRSKGGIKRFFQIKKGDHLYFLKEIKYCVKHFRTQMEFLLILQKRCSYESVSCCNSSNRG